MLLPFAHSEAVRAAFPTLACGIVQVAGISADADASIVMRSHLDRALKRLSLQSEGDFPEIQAWRRAFSAMGLKPTQYRCASEALLRRLRKEGTLPALHPLVDLCNAVSVAFAIPIAVFDIEQVEGGLTVRPARGDERYDTFSGTIETPEPGEIIFADEGGRAHARRWTNRQSAVSAVGPATTDVLIVAEALHPDAQADIERLIASLNEAVRSAWPKASVEDWNAA